MYRRGLFIFSLLPSMALAQEPEEEDAIVGADPYDDTSTSEIPRIDVIGRQRGALQGVPGAASVITEEDLRAQSPLSANEALRVLPGVNIREEEGIGLRPNIGLRGLNPSRSSNLLVLEDGVPVSLAPYGEPELYYAPAIEAMERLELVKGSGSILFGPQTIGGVLNYITAEPPRERTLDAEARLGTFGYGMARASIGDTHGDVGYRLSVMHQRFAGHRALNLRVTDVRGALRLQISPRSYVGVKLNVYDELSNATYLGLTTPQFESDPRANFASNDVLPVQRFSGSVTHNASLNDDLLLQTTLYANRTTRDWTRQDFDRAYVEGRDYDRIIDGRGRDVLGQGGYDDDGSSIFFRNSTGSRIRAFNVLGAESRLTWSYSLSSSLRGELKTGVRYHAERTVEQRLDGETPSSTSGVLRQDERRQGDALSAFVHNRFTLADRLKLSPGLRVESFWHGRDILRSRVDGTPTDHVRPLQDRDHIFALIPGLGTSFDLTPDVAIYAGAHRGFAPPRTKDAVTATGETLELEAEYSWNYEVGARVQLEQGIRAEVTGYLLDFQNQVIAPTEASGLLGVDSALLERALINGGETRHMGVETSLVVDPGALMDWRFNLPLMVNYTYTYAVFGDSWKEGIVGNRLPYAPEHIIAGQARFVHPSGLSVQGNIHYLSEQYHDVFNTREAAIDGTNGVIDARTLLDARIGFNLERYVNQDIELYVMGKNLTDERFIAARAPQGIQPGMFRQVLGGVRGSFK
ncbi:MAG: TonB-dependent receptor [Deltaproteobacteria bacterium]|nr:MAG: TonB-dependent receptor [Deltaproteobacteria bacterium]